MLKGVARFEDEFQCWVTSGESISMLKFNLDETERGAAGFGSTGVSMNAENNTAEPRKSSEQNEKLMDLDSPVSPKKRKALSEVDAN
ncbi:unnamed protein product [Notodromas monacha]|uniref:Uncharacterized protein n=1 Tax=Notodromas monacha TaxID=399045 RepID=A0A7R9BG58_9CRUS|nr:unnamed protein product [Notodromas monacha]CAG0913249.1 unnamed protein product [Notodromas monacha]